jgi:hypothetical protein
MTAKPKKQERQKQTEWREVLTYDALVHRGVFNNRMTLKRAMDKYGFPRPYKLGERRVAWNREAVEAWLASRRQNAEAGAQQ